MVRIGVFLTGLLTLLLGGIVALSRTQNPAGSWIAYATYSRYAHNVVSSWRYEIRVIDPDGHQIRNIPAESPNAPPPTISWSPNGQWLQEMYEDTGTITWILPASGERVRTVTADEYTIPAWSSGNKQLVYVTPERTGRQLSVMNPAVIGTEVEFESVPFEWTPYGDSRIDALTWSPDDEWIAYAVFAGDVPGIFRVRPDGTDTERPAGPYRDCHDVTWSKDAQWLYYLCDETGLSRVHADGTDDTRLFPDLPGQTAFGFSPSADRLWIVTHDYDLKTSDLYLARADGTGLRLVTSTVTLYSTMLGNRPPVWSPDGRWITFAVTEPIDTYGEDVNRLYVADAQTGTVHLINEQPIAQGYSWSPDSEWIVYGTTSSTYYETTITRARPDGTDRRLLVTHDPNYASHIALAWSPACGKLHAEIVFAAGLLLSGSGMVWPRVRRRVARQ